MLILLEITQTLRSVLNKLFKYKNLIDLFESTLGWKSNTVDVTTEAYDDAKAFKLVAIFILLLLRRKYNCNCIALYHENESSVFKNIKKNKQRKIKGCS